MHYATNQFIPVCRQPLEEGFMGLSLMQEEGFADPGGNLQMGFEYC
jgi:hypothetical protein